MAVVSTFDFANFDRPLMSVTLNDEAKTVLKVKMPTEGVYDTMKKFNKELPNMADEDASDVLYALTATILSNNTDNKTVSSDELKKNAEYDAIIAFFNSFFEYIQSQIKIKN